ncbi:hypothetical protein [Microbulbifer sp. PSTR4-B]|uniref:hypothetical protein n=1 Tax=unclassified Microbulbifer TaxID=2619833 RepID=UPI00403ABDDB
MRKVTKPGRCASAWERGAGAIVHLVQSEEDQTNLYTKALCGTAPAGRLGWTDHSGGGGIAATNPPTTCTKCRTLGESGAF